MPVHDPKTHDCELPDLKPVEHPAVEVDWNGPSSIQGYQVYICRWCKTFWGCRYQWDAGTGEDSRWYNFHTTNPREVKRHY